MAYVEILEWFSTQQSHFKIGGLRRESKEIDPKTQASGSAPGYVPTLPLISCDLGYINELPCA